jgi:6-phosphogluconolactonase (cycloisomerase 2 family)
VANSNPGVVSLKIDPASGALSPAGAYEVIEQPWSLAFSRDKVFGYVSTPDNGFTGFIGVYAADAQTGALTDTTLHTELDGLAGPMAFDARQAYALAPIQFPGYPGGFTPYNEVQSLPISHTTGGIEGPAQHSVHLDVAPAELMTDPADRYVYVRIYTGEFVEVLPFDAATGAMGPPGKPAMARACDLVFY